jgi:hypothetical protein
MSLSSRAQRQAPDPRVPPFSGHRSARGGVSGWPISGLARGAKSGGSQPSRREIVFLFFSCSFPFLIFKFSNLLSNLVLNFKFN